MSHDDPTRMGTPTPGGPGYEPTSPKAGDGREPTDPCDEQTITPTPGMDVDPLLGIELGNYRVEALLGKGGFGRVYKAYDTKLQRIVAIKFLIRPDTEQDYKLFEREATTIASLNKHPNVVQIYEWGEYQDLTYFVLEYVPMSASTLIHTYPKGLPLEIALGRTLECARALASAHENGVIHRDIKPANILLEGEAGPAKIADFGLTRIMDSSEASLITGVSGSPPYMSPEQASADSLDHRTDIFSLGVVLYELLSGGRPFEGDTSGEVMSRIRSNKRVPLAQRASNLPPWVIQIVDKATAHKASKRFATAAEMADILEAALEACTSNGAAPTVVTGASSRLRRGVVWAVGLAAACAVFVAGSMLLSGNEQVSALQQGRVLMDAGDAAAAMQFYDEYLERDPGNAEAQIGLGYARLKLGERDEAREVFGQVADAALRNEGEGAVAFDEKGAGAQQNLEALAGDGATDYLRVLVARAALGGGDENKALEALRQVGEGRLTYGWQQGEYLQALGQAYYRLKQFDEAQSAFQALRTSGVPADSAAVDQYLRAVERQMNKEHREEVTARAKRLGALMDDEGYEPPDEAGDWDSRPRGFFVLPTESLVSSAAVPASIDPAEITDLLHMFVGEALADRPPLRLVERELINELLAEQELSAHTSSEDGRVALGKVLGARLVIQCQLGAVGGEGFVKLCVVDTENTTSLTSKQVRLSEVNDLYGLAEEIATRISAKVDREYPLQGRATVDGDRVRLSVGKSVGVVPGMRFALASEPDTYKRVPDASAVVTEDVGDDWAVVALEGIEPAQIPVDGLYAFEEGGAQP
ncbi:MAG: protein kinase [bacterium]|nr:protein kinase [bacterium]